MLAHLLLEGGRLATNREPLGLDVLRKLGRSKLRRISDAMRGGRITQHRLFYAGESVPRPLLTWTSGNWMTLPPAWRVASTHEPSVDRQTQNEPGLSPDSPSSAVLATAADRSRLHQASIRWAIGIGSVEATES